VGERTRDFACVSLCYGRRGEEMCPGYAMATSGRMQYDHKQTNEQHTFVFELRCICEPKRFYRKVFCILKTLVKVPIR